MCYKGGEELFRYIPPHLKRVYKVRACLVVYLVSLP